MSDASPLIHPARRFSLLRSFGRNFLLALVLFAPLHKVLTQLKNKLIC